MRGRVATRIAIAVAVAALAAGCGSGGGGGQNGDTQPGDPTSTPTPEPTVAAVATATPAAATPGAPTPAGPTPAGTATPTVTTARVTFEITAGEALLAFQLTATYPTAKGGFRGSADHVQCATPSREIFTKNDGDDGSLVLSVANAAALRLPVTIICTFDLTGGDPLLADDLAITAVEVTDETGAVGDPATLMVDVGVS